MNSAFSPFDSPLSDSGLSPSVARSFRGLRTPCRPPPCCLKLFRVPSPVIRNPFHHPMYTLFFQAIGFSANLRDGEPFFSFRSDLPFRPRFTPPPPSCESSVGSLALPYVERFRSFEQLSPSNASLSCLASWVSGFAFLIRTLHLHHLWPWLAKFNTFAPSDFWCRPPPRGDSDFIWYNF